MTDPQQWPEKIFAYGRDGRTLTITIMTQPGPRNVTAPRPWSAEPVFTDRKGPPCPPRTGTATPPACPGASN